MMGTEPTIAASGPGRGKGNYRGKIGDGIVATLWENGSTGHLLYGNIIINYTNIVILMVTQSLYNSL